MSRAAGPTILKGAIVALDSTSPSSPPSVIAFQYNPERVRRSLTAQVVGGDPGSRTEAVVFTGAPVETIEVDVDIDATDQMNSGNSPTIYPQLSTLELLTFPTSTDVTTQTTLLGQGTIEVGPFVAPLALFVWGSTRVVPVRIDSLSISEELFGSDLSPIRATVTMTLRVLSYSDLAPNSLGYNLFLQYQQVKESVSTATSSLAGTGITTTNLQG